MKHHFQVMLVVGLVLLISASMSFAQSTSSVRGVVVSASTGAPLSGVEVFLGIADPSGNSTEARYTCTNPEGVFVFLDVPAGVDLIAATGVEVGNSRCTNEFFMEQDTPLVMQFYNQRNAFSGLDTFQTGDTPASLSFRIIPWPFSRRENDLARYVQNAHIYLHHGQNVEAMTLMEDLAAEVRQRLEADEIEVERAETLLTFTEGYINLFSSPAAQAESPANCMVSTDQARTVRVRVGFGENRTAVTFLPVDTEFEVLGQNADDSGATWYALDREDAAPGKSIRGDVAWVAAAEVEATGDCHAVPLMAATGIIPILGSPPSGEGEDVADITIITIGNQPDWVDSGIAVSAGQSFTLEVRGRMNPCLDTYPNGADYCVFYAPQGARGVVPRQNEYGIFPAPGQRFMAMLGRIGDSEPFIIGAGGTFTAEQAGTLWLTPNDNRRTDNRGTYRVLVWFE